MGVQNPAMAWGGQQPHPAKANDLIPVRNALQEDTV